MEQKCVRLETALSTLHPGVDIQDLVAAQPSLSTQHGSLDSNIAEMEPDSPNSETQSEAVDDCEWQEDPLPNYVDKSAQDGMASSSTDASILGYMGISSRSVINLHVVWN